MRTKYHIEITHLALSEHFSEKALKEVIRENIRQDRITNQFGHDYIHFDGNAFDAGFDYINHQNLAIIKGVVEENFSCARQALGRLTHSWQDFYSHSNYVKLWLSMVGNLPPEEIVVNDSALIDHPELKSGKNYGLIEFFAMLPVISKWVKPLMPADSHARMNLDGPEAGDLFHYAYAAAFKQTSATFEQLIDHFNYSGTEEKKIRSFLEV